MHDINGQCDTVVKEMFENLKRMKVDPKRLFSVSGLRSLEETEYVTFNMILRKSPCYVETRDVSKIDDYKTWLQTYAFAFKIDGRRLKEFVEFMAEDNTLSYEKMEMAVFLKEPNKEAYFDTIIRRDSYWSPTENGLIVMPELKKKYEGHAFKIVNDFVHVSMKEGKLKVYVSFKDIIWVKQKHYNPITHEEEYAYPGSIWREIRNTLNQYK